MMNARECEDMRSGCVKRSLLKSAGGRHPRGRGMQSSDRKTTEWVQVYELLWF